MKSLHLSQKENFKTEGRLIPWAGFYDFLVWVLTLGKAPKLRAEMLEMAHIQKGDKILDVGCGTGSLALLAKARGGSESEVFGIDASAKMISLAREKAVRENTDVKFSVGAMEALDFKENEFDTVLSTLVMHHLPQPVKEQGLAEMVRVLKPKGRLVIVDIQSTPGGSTFRKFSDLIIQAHGGHGAMGNNVSNLLPLMEKMGLKHSRMEKINRQLAAILGEKG